MKEIFRVALGFCILCIGSVTAETPTFRIEGSRSRIDLNSVTLSCRSGMDNMPVANAQFFRNKVLFKDGLRNNDGSSITFIATRITEGNFSCGKTGEEGTVTMSSSIPILGRSNLPRDVFFVVIKNEVMNFKWLDLNHSAVHSVYIS